MMKKIAVMIAVMAFAFSATANCGSCEAGSDKKPKKECCGKEEGKCCKDSKEKKHDHDH